MKTLFSIFIALMLAMPMAASAQLTVSQGGTGLTSVTANNILYGVSASLRLGSEAAFTYNPSTNLFTTTYASTTGLSATNGDLSKLTVTYASSTGLTATNGHFGTATGTNLFGFGLPGAGCNGVGQAVTWSSGLFGCTTITASGDGVSNWSYNGSRLSPTTTVGIGVFASSTIGGGTGATGLTINGTGTSTNFVVTGLTGSRAVFTDASDLLTSTAASAALSGSLSDETGTGVAVFSAGPSFTGTPTFSNLFVSTTGSTTLGYASTTALTISGASYLGTPTSLTLTNATGLPVSTGISGLGTGVATALAVNTGSAGAFVVNGGALGTPSSGTLTNATGLPISTGVSGLGSNVATLLATFSSANLATALTDETGTAGSAVFSTNPLLAGFRSNASSTVGDGTGTGGLTVNGTATSTNLKVTALTASRLIATAADKLMTSVSNLTSWIAGTSNEITVTDDGDGTVTLSLPSTIDLGGKTSLEIPNGANPTVDATGEIALNTSTNALSVATSTTALELPLYPPLAFAYASSSWTGTTTDIGYVTLTNFDETITSGICYADGAGKIVIGDGTASSSITTLAAGTTTVTVNKSFNKNGRRVIVAIGTPTTLSKVQCKFERLYKR